MSWSAPFCDQQSGWSMFIPKKGILLVSTIICPCCVISSGVLLCVILPSASTSFCDQRSMRPKLTEVPENIPSNCTMVDLSRNRITRLASGVFRNLTLCTEMDLEHNQISVIDDNAFQGLSSLHTLFLSQNNLSAIPTNVELFSGLINLQSLHLGWNKVSALSADQFAGLDNLTFLSLYENEISLIERGAFTGLSHLTKLDLWGNQISEITEGAFTGLSNLKKMWLEKMVYLWFKTVNLQVSATYRNYCCSRIGY